VLKCFTFFLETFLPLFDIVTVPCRVASSSRPRRCSLFPRYESWEVSDHFYTHTFLSLLSSPFLPYPPPLTPPSPLFEPRKLCGWFFNLLRDNPVSSLEVPPLECAFLISCMVGLFPGPFHSPSCSSLVLFPTLLFFFCAEP